MSKQSQSTDDQEKILRVGDAILTPAVIAFIVFMQSGNNETISLWRDIVTDAAAKIINTARENSLELKQKDNELIGDLFNLRDELLTLCKP